MENQEEREVTEIQFWKETPYAGQIRIEIISSKFIKFLESKGYRKLVKKNNFQLVKVKHSSVISPVEVFQMRDEIRKHFQELDREDVWEEFLQADFLSKRITEGIESISIDFDCGDEKTAYFFYQNGVLKVTKNTIGIITYEDYDGFVWEDQIIPREFMPTNSQNAEFRRFCIDLSRNNPERLLSLQSIIGYTLHGYKDPSLTKAIVLMDEVIDIDAIVSEGGTGKSLLTEGVGKMIPCLRKNGKNLSTDSRFFFADVEPHHQVMVFDDVKADFQFESLYSMITGELPIEKKYKNPVIIGFKEVPKVIITSNYLVRGTGGNSEERRKVEFEVSPYYRQEETVVEKFGHRFFDDWTMAEWYKFDNFMIACTQVFLNKGIIEPDPINITRNRLMAETHPSFVSFMQEALENPGSYEGEESATYIKFNKANLFRKFRRTHPDCHQATAIRFKKWMDKYADINDIEIEHMKSNSLTYVKFKK
ncbi:primase-helicase family protein [Mesonia sp. K7]|uniref:primase-helicase family protein n=1 Tax=Mesonia sp. K7 TaxID=2218606 RepID=UPI000DA9AF85|nr:primase-helicase family protein [Mesonia sp. K7]PZD77463.1 hypothetical protein DNG35_09110 [Mesonia sp. K7]